MENIASSTDENQKKLLSQKLFKFLNARTENLELKFNGDIKELEKIKYNFYDNFKKRNNI
jgi:hypothetical protein